MHIERDAMGDDEYHPISQRGSNLSHVGGIGYTVVDSLDTMIIMGLDEEVERAKSWIRDKLSFDRDDSFNLFEVLFFYLSGACSYTLLNENSRLPSEYWVVCSQHITSLVRTLYTSKKQ